MSERRKLRKDEIIEKQYGNGAIRTRGKILLSDIGKRGGEFDRTLILGVITENLLSELNKRGYYNEEMWELELILIPKRKFIGHTAEAGWSVLGVDQKLASGWDHRDKWKKRVDLS